MFPNFRLMIVAVVSSVVALSCGFAMFAAFRVNHEPFTRLPPAGSLHLVAGNAAPPSMTFAMAKPPDRGLPTSEPQTTQSIEQPPAKAALPAADDHAAATSATVSQAAAVVALGASRLSASQVAKLPDTRQVASPTNAAEASGGSLLAPAPHIAVIEPSTDQARPAEQTTPAAEITPASNAGTAVKTEHGASRPAAARKTAHTRLAARTHHTRRRRGSAFAQYDAPHFISAQPNFQSAPRPARVRHYITSAASRSAVGGPYVSPRGQ